MPIMSPPNVPPQSPHVVMIAQTNQAVRFNAERAMGVCYVVANIPDAFEKYSAGVFPSQSLVYPWEDVSAYFREFEHRNIHIYEGNIGGSMPFPVELVINSDVRYDRVHKVWPVGTGTRVDA